MFRHRWSKRKFNRVILTLVYADFIFYIAVGFLTPIVAVFYVSGVQGGSVAMAGFATALFWIVKSAVQIPVSIYADKKKGEADDFALMVIGYLIIGVVYLCYYLFVDTIWEVFMMDAIQGVGYGLMIPTYLAIYTRHIDRGAENTEWTLHSNAVGLGYAAAAAVGGLMAERFGFRSVFLLTASLAFLAPVVLLLVKNEFSASDGGDGSVDGFGMTRQKELAHH